MPWRAASPRLSFGAALLAAALSAEHAFSEEEPGRPPSAFADAPLWPLIELARPEPPGAAPARVIGGCPVPPAAALPGPALPFGPGEVLTYDISLLGIRTGRAALRFSELGELDQVPVYALYADARTEGFFSVLGSLDGRMVSFLDPSAFTPVRMANRFFIARLGEHDVVAREDAAFAGRAVRGRLSYRHGDGRRDTHPARLRGSSDLVDVLSVVYYMRTRALPEGARFCFELYHRRRLWRVEGAAGPLEVATSPYGARRARRIEGRLSLVGSDARPRAVTTWISEDRDRLPLAVETPDLVGTLRVGLTHFTPGKRLVRDP